MITNEYLRVDDIAKQQKITMKTVRNKIQKLIGLVPNGKIIKDNNDNWRIHYSIKEMFKPERVHKLKYTAFTIDPVYNYSYEDLLKIVSWINGNINENDFELNFSIEPKKANNRLHLHFYFKKSVSGKFLKSAKLAFHDMNYHSTEIYDLDGWKNYISKENKIITLKK
jgi:hypothetical protein